MHSFRPRVRLAVSIVTSVMVLTCLTVQPARAAGRSISVVSGNNQVVPLAGTSPNGPSIPTGTAKFAPLTVLVLGADGKPAAGVDVSWQCKSTPVVICMLNGGIVGPSVNGGVFNEQVNNSLTDQSGHAVLNGMNGNSMWVIYGTGAFPITAEVTLADNTSALAPLATFTLTVPNDKLSIDAGNNAERPRVGGAKGTPTIASFSDQSVLLTDAGGHPVSGAAVTLTCKAQAPMKCGFGSQALTTPTTTITTNSNGVAGFSPANGLSAFYVDGPLSLSATYQGQSVSFALSVKSRACLPAVVGQVIC
jgi:hypothetical protein